MTSDVARITIHAKPDELPAAAAFAQTVLHPDTHWPANGFIVQHRIGNDGQALPAFGARRTTAGLTIYRDGE